MRRCHELCAGRRSVGPAPALPRGGPDDGGRGIRPGEPSSAIAKEFRVSVRSVQRWRWTWDKGGPRILRSTGPASPPRLSEAQFAQLDAELAKSPVARGWSDQTLDALQGRDRDRPPLPQSYTLQGLRKLLIRHGFSCQIPGRQTCERPVDGVGSGHAD